MPSTLAQMAATMIAATTMQSIHASAQRTMNLDHTRSAINFYDAAEAVACQENGIIRFRALNLVRERFQRPPGLTADRQTGATGFVSTDSVGPDGSSLGEAGWRSGPMFVVRVR